MPLLNSIAFSFVSLSLSPSFSSLSLPLSPPSLPLTCACSRPRARAASPLLRRPRARRRARASSGAPTRRPRPGEGPARRGGRRQPRPSPVMRGVFFGVDFFFHEMRERGLGHACVQRKEGRGSSCSQRGDAGERLVFPRSMGIRSFINRRQISPRLFLSLPSYPHPCGQFFALLEQCIPVHADICGHFWRKSVSDERRRTN